MREGRREETRKAKKEEGVEKEEREGDRTVIYDNSVSPSIEICFDDTIQLLEGGQTGGTHPDDEILVLKIADHSHSIGASVRILEFVIDIRIPCYALLLQRNEGIVGVEQLEGI